MENNAAPDKGAIGTVPRAPQSPNGTLLKCNALPKACFYSCYRKKCALENKPNARHAIKYCRILVCLNDFKRK